MTMSMRRTLKVALAAALFWAFAVAGSAQVAPDQRQYDPLYAGIGSQAGEPAEQKPDPTFFFEERVNWPALQKQIPGGEPRTAWEYAQRGMYKQDELEDVAAAVADYQTSESMNPRIQIVQARLAVIALKDAEHLEELGQYQQAVTRLDEAIGRLDHILEESPFHQSLHYLLGEAYEAKHTALDQLGDASGSAEALAKAEEEFQQELELAPASQRSHLALAELLIEEGRNDQAVQHLTVYLCQAKLHSDTVPLRILKARKERQDLTGGAALNCDQTQMSAR
jgi:tetratricopeptide (TPR) repeat protein